MGRMHLLAACTLLTALAAPAAAQIPIRSVSAPEAVSRDTVGFVYGVRELSDGRVIVNDAGMRRVSLLDQSLVTARIVADSAAGAPAAYGRQPTGIIPYLADSTLFIDLAARAFLVIDPQGRVGRVMSPPRPGDVSYMWNPALGTPTLDPRGRLVYRSWVMPSFRGPEPGKKWEPPQMPDSAPILRGDFDRRAADTVAWVKIPLMRRSVTYFTGGVRIGSKINPVSTLDDWAALPDGSIAVLRGQDYHIDWFNADGTRSSSPKMPFDWKRMTDEEKAAIVDSTKAALERQVAAAPTREAAMAIGGHSMTIMGATPPDGSSPTRTEAELNTPRVPEVVPPEDLPDYVPPVLRSGTMKSDPQGNIWVLPSTSARGEGGLLYDVVNRQGEIAFRVRIPAQRALVGFGANGALYLTSHEPGGARLERVRLARTQANDAAASQPTMVPLRSAAPAPLVAQAAAPSRGMPGVAPAIAVELAAPRVEVPVRFVEGARPTVTTIVNGKGPFVFAIETGAPMVVFTTKLAAAAGLRDGATGHPGQHPGQPAKVADSLRIGGALFRDVPVAVLPALLPGVDGLLGLPAYAGLLMTIDYPGQRVTFERGALPEPDGEEVLPATRRGPFMSIPVTAGGRTVPGVIDTQSAFGISFAPLMLDSLPFIAPPTVVGSARVGGQAPVEVKAGRLDGAIGIGAYTLPRPIVRTLVTLPGQGNNALIGTQVLREFALTLDQANMRVRLQRRERELPVDPPLRTIGVSLANSPDGNVVISLLPEWAPGAQAGLKVGDVVRSIAGRGVREFAPSRDVVTGYEIGVLAQRGQPVRFEVTRAGAPLSIEVVPSTRVQ